MDKLSKTMFNKGDQSNSALSPPTSEASSGSARPSGWKRSSEKTPSSTPKRSISPILTSSAETPGNETRSDRPDLLLSISQPLAGSLLVETAIVESPPTISLPQAPNPPHTKEGSVEAFYIVNVQTGDYAALFSDNDRAEIVNTTDKSDRGSQWFITHIKKNEYWIQNVAFKSFACYDNRPRAGDGMLGKWATLDAKPSLWRIRATPSSNASYTISPLENPDIFWRTSTNVERGTPLDFGQPWTARHCQWVFKAASSNSKSSPIIPSGEAGHAYITHGTLEQKSFLKDLKPSKIANHKYNLEGNEGKLLRRTECTPGTRVHLLDNITTWVKDSSPESPDVYWLFGHAGSGKSTIAYTVARRFELPVNSDSTVILGGNFFCSRQFEETKQSKWIVRTIAYQLACVCDPFADALRQSETFDCIEHGVHAQIQGLLVKPWAASEDARAADPLTPSHYLVVIDALDEIDGEGSSHFLRDLFDVLNKGQLSGLKFFAASRPDPDLVNLVDSFKRKQRYRLQDVGREEVSSDIRTYLRASLPYLTNVEDMEKLVTVSDGLFIYSATAVRYLADVGRAKQEYLLKRLISLPSSVIPKRSGEDSLLLDGLYYQILVDAFHNVHEDFHEHLLQILHTFLCTPEPTSGAVAAQLLCSPNERDVYIESATDVVIQLHSVLYAEHGRVLFYHKSFSDFMFARDRSKRFWCDQSAHHLLLTESCFRAMEVGLKFNIANIPSSFILDRDNSTLSAEVKRNVTDVLGYSCRNWHNHLSPASLASPAQLCAILQDFLQLRALFWMEVMNLLELIGRCDVMLRTASDWVTKSDPVLASNFAEAANFAVYFGSSPAALSTPHLYLSAHATWPANVEPCRGWRSYFPRLPAFFNAIGGGSMSLMTLKTKGAARSVAFSTDGTRIVSGSTDRSVLVWNASTGEELRILDGHTDRVNSVAFSTNGSQIVSGSSDGSVRVWNGSTGEELRVLEGHTSVVNSVAFSTDDSRIVSGSYDQSVRVWSVLTGEELRVLDGHTKAVYSVAFSTDGSRIVSASSDRSVRVWNALTGEGLRVLDGHTDAVYSVAFSTDGSRIVSGSDDRSVRVWSVSTGEELRVLDGHTDRVNSVAFSTDGSQIVSGSYDQSVRVWSASSGEGLRVLDGHTDAVSSVAFSTDGSRIMSSSDDRSVRVWTAPTGKEPRFLDGHTDAVSSVAFSTDGSQIVSGSNDRSLRVWNASTGEELRVLDGHTGPVNSVAFSIDGSRIVSGSSDRSVRVWNVSTGKQLRVLNGHTSEVSSVAFATNRGRIVSGSADGSVWVWNASRGKEPILLDGHSNVVYSVAFSTDGSRIFSGSQDRSVRVWNLLTGDAVRVLDGHTSTVSSVAFSPDGGRIVSGSDDGSVRVWIASTGEELRVLEGHTNAVYSVAFSTDGSRIVSASEDRSVRVWNVLTGEGLRVLDGHTSTVSSVAFSPDGGRIVSGSDDGSVRVWSALTGEDLNIMRGHGEDADGGPAYIRERHMDNSRYRRYTGWLLSPSGEGYLMFVPPDARLPDSSNILTIPRHAVSYVDFSRVKLGTRWHECYCH